MALEKVNCQHHGEQTVTLVEGDLYICDRCSEESHRDPTIQQDLATKKIVPDGPIGKRGSPRAKRVAVGATPAGSTPPVIPPGQAKPKPSPPESKKKGKGKP